MPFTKDKNNSTEKINIDKIHRLVLYIVLLTMFLFSYVNARLTFSQLEEIQTREIKTSCDPHIINPEGPLNLIRGYIYKKCGFMYNKRLFSPEIEIMYSLEPESKETYKDGRDACVFERSITKDNAYKPANEEEKYGEEYHRTLIKMFPSLDNNTTPINSANPYSFTNFLRVETLKGNNTLYFLAALLLLSEGIEMPIECVDNRIIMRRKNGEYFFTLDTKAIEYNAIDNTEKQVPRPGAMETMEIIKFFKDNEKTVKIEPKSLKEFKKGYFLDTPQFLIQTYLFEFLETVENAGNFNQAVSEILCDMYSDEIIQVDNPSTQETLSSKLSKYFVSSDSSSEAMVYLNDLNEIELIISYYEFLSFSKSVCIIYSLFLPYYNRNSDKFSSCGNFSNQTETFLYTLFCCLLYNPETENTLWKR